MVYTPSKEEMDEFVMTGKGIEAIEDSLADLSLKLYTARKIRNDSKSNEESFFSRAKNRAELDEIILDAKQETKAFLGVNVYEEPVTKVVGLSDKILFLPRAIYSSLKSTIEKRKVNGKLIYGIDNGYDAYHKVIRFNPSNKAEAFSEYAHEYDHYLQDFFKLVKPIWRWNNFSFLEGHARCVELNVSLDKTEKMDNPAFAVYSLERFLGEMKSAYKHYIRKMGRGIKEILLRISCPNDNYEAKLVYDLDEPSDYASGAAFFTAKEAEMGKSVYTDVLLGKKIV